MDLQRMITKRNLILLGIAFLILIMVIVIVSVLLQPKTQRIELKELGLPAPTPADIHNNEVYMSNGRYFIAYNPANGETRQLSKDGQLPLIGTLRVSPDGKKIVAQTVKQTTADPMGQQIAQRGLPLDEPYWWVIDTDTDTITLLQDNTGKPAKMLLAQFNGNQLAGIAQEVERSTLLVFDQSFKASAAELPSNTTFFSLSGDKLVAQTGSQLVRYQVNNNQVTTVENITDDVALSSISPNGQYAFVAKSSQGEQLEGYVLNTETGEQTLHSTISETVPVWSKDGSYIVIPSKPSTDNSLGLIRANVTNNSSSELAVAEGRVSLGRLYAANDKYIITSDAAFSPFIAAIDASAVVNDLPHEDARYESDNITIDFTPDNNLFMVSAFNSINQPSDRQKTYDLLRQNNLNPDLLNIEFEFILNR